MARLTLARRKLKVKKLAMAMQWWLNILHLLGLFIQLSYKLFERQCMGGVISRYQLDFYGSREIIESWVYKSDHICMSNIRRTRRPFVKLCPLLSTIGKLEPTKHMLVDEQVAISLHILAHHVKSRVIQSEFNRSAESISRHFKKVFIAVIRQQGELYKKPKPIPENLVDEKLKWLRDV